MIREGNFTDAENIVKEAIEISKEPKIPFYIQKGQKLLDDIKSYQSDQVQ